MPKAVKKSPKKGGKVAGKRAKKDPNAPKRGQSAYMIWLNENRKSLTKPGMGVTDVAKAAGVEWGKMTNKTTWEAKAATDKKRYEREMAVFKGSPKKAAAKK